MQRYFLEISFDGTAYHGWQIQPNALTVQEVLNKALAVLLRGEVETTGCGRTDTGVHARQLYVHFDAEPVSADFLYRLNALLPPDVAALSLRPVHADAHARFDATSRSYEYHIHFQKDPFLLNRSWYMRDRPDIRSMNEAAEVLKGISDFSSFSKSNTQTFTNNCRISEALWKETDQGMVFHISADRFLRNMVRAIVGTLLQVGLGKIPPSELSRIAAAMNRSEAGASVPACGLYLTRINYPYL